MSDQSLEYELRKHNKLMEQLVEYLHRSSGALVVISELLLAEWADMEPPEDCDEQRTAQGDNSGDGE